VPEAGSWRVQIDDDRIPLEDDGLGALVDGATGDENPLEGERVADSSAVGGYPEVAERELPKPDDSAADGLSVADDDGVLHTESRAVESLGV
jgi:hypothetical protein